MRLPRYRQPARLATALLCAAASARALGAQAVAPTYSDDAWLDLAVPGAIAVVLLLWLLRRRSDDETSRLLVLVPLMEALQARRHRDRPTPDPTHVEPVGAWEPAPRYSWEHYARCAMWVAVPCWIGAAWSTAEPTSMLHTRGGVALALLMLTFPAMLAVVALHAAMLSVIPLRGRVASAVYGAMIATVAGMTMHGVLDRRVPYGRWTLVGAGAGLVAAVLARRLADPADA